MTAATKEKGGSFQDLKAHLPLFEEAVHRHDRGWPHARQPEHGSMPRKPQWKTVGIFHFRQDEEAEG